MRVGQNDVTWKTIALLAVALVAAIIAYNVTPEVDSPGLWLVIVLLLAAAPAAWAWRRNRSGSR